MVLAFTQVPLDGFAIHDESSWPFVFDRQFKLVVIDENDGRSMDLLKSVHTVNTLMWLEEDKVDSLCFNSIIILKCFRIPWMTLVACEISATKAVGRSHQVAGPSWV